MHAGLLDFGRASSTALMTVLFPAPNGPVKIHTGMRMPPAPNLPPPTTAVIKIIAGFCLEKYQPTGEATLAPCRSTAARTRDAGPYFAISTQTLTAPRGASRSAASRSPRFRIATAAAKKDAPKKEEPKEEAGSDFKGLKQLISMGLGTISGDITEINLKDPTRTVVMELEANNFEDKDGNPLWKPDDKGYVAESSEALPVMNYVVPVVLGIGAIGGVVATLNAL